MANRAREEGVGNSRFLTYYLLLITYYLLLITYYLLLITYEWLTT